ncbi:MAG: Crp/Fnr family transcriptional regulator [Cyclobacteriaceae bacterium]
MEQEIDLIRIKEYISKFVSFSEEEIESFLKQLTKKKIPKGGYILQAGQICDYVAFINKGHFRSLCLVNNEEETYNFFFEGNFFTDYPSFLSRQPSIESHQALEDAEVLMITYTNMQLIYKEFPCWEKFGRLIAEYIIMGIAERNRSMLYMSPEERYLNLMKTRPKVIANIPQHYIASYLGIQPESLSRIRKRLATTKRL